MNKNKQKQERNSGKDWFQVSTRKAKYANNWGTHKYAHVHLKDLTLEEWLNSRGGRTIEDVMQDGKDKFVEMYYPRNKVQMVYLPKQWQ